MRQQIYLDLLEKLSVGVLTSNGANNKKNGIGMQMMKLTLMVLDELKSRNGCLFVVIEPPLL